MNPAGDHTMTTPALRESVTQLDPLGPLVIRLDRMIANLDQHIDQRAAEIAEPQVAYAEALAAERDTTLREERHRWDQRLADLQTEFQRQIAVLQRNSERYRQRAEAVEDVIVKTHDHLGRNLAGLVGKSGYEVGYRACASEVTSILDSATGQEPDHG